MKAKAKQWIKLATVCGAVGTALAANGQNAATNAPAEWTSLFAAEAWYKQQDGAEQVFRGTLQTAQPPQASALMRATYYTLGERAVYTGARKIPALDTLAGRVVEIRGKAVNMELEGQNLNEIWPAAIRPAAGSDGVTAPGPKAPDKATALKLAAEFLSRNKVQAAGLQAFRMPPSGAWWMVEYHEEGKALMSPGPTVYVNRETGEVTRQAPQDAPARL